MTDHIIRKFVSGIRNLKRKIVTVYLFGSRARGSERPDSDYDLLLVVTDEFSLGDRRKLYDVVMDVLLETGRLVSLKIFKESQFQRFGRLETPFMRNVLKEGIKIG